MLIDLIGTARMVAWETERARWQREFGGWRAIGRQRFDRVAPYRMVLSLRFAGHLERLRWAHDCRRGWRILQRVRIARRRWDHREIP